MLFESQLRLHKVCIILARSHQSACCIAQLAEHILDTDYSVFGSYSRLSNWRALGMSIFRSLTRPLSLSLSLFLSLAIWSCSNGLPCSCRHRCFSFGSPSNRATKRSNIKRESEIKARMKVKRLRGLFMVPFASSPLSIPILVLSVYSSAFSR